MQAYLGAMGALNERILEGLARWQATFRSCSAYALLGGNDARHTKLRTGWPTRLRGDGGGNRARWTRLPRCWPRTDKSFLLLFFKKEVLA